MSALKEDYGDRQILFSYESAYQESDNGSTPDFDKDAFLGFIKDVQSAVMDNPVPPQMYRRQLGHADNPISNGGRFLSTRQRIKPYREKWLPC